MQIASLLNVTASSPATVASGAAKGSGVAVAGAPTAASALSINGLPNTGSLADALLTAQTASPAQFAGLLASQQGQTGKILATDTKDTQQTATAIDPTTVAQNGAIAIPPVGLYIDQPIQNVVLSQDNSNTIDVNANSGKKLVFAADTNINTVQAPAAVSSKPLPLDADATATAASPTLANEVYNKQEVPIAKISNTTTTAGKIKLANVDTSTKDADFQTAFTNIVDQAKTKTTATAQNVQADTKIADDQVTDTNTKTLTVDKATSTAALTQPQAVAGKISAKVIGIKEDKISLTDDATPEMTAKLDNFAAQLDTKNYAQIKDVAQTLPQTAADQVQVKITQALASNENTIKINLHPAELGAVNVNMMTDDQGNTKIHIIADKSDTLQMLRQDSTHLVKSLSEVGIKADAGSLQFSLRGDQSQQNFAQNQNQSGAAANDNNGQQQNNQQQANAATATYSRFTNLNEQTLTLSQNNGLNILV